MKLTLKEFEELNEIEVSIHIVENLINILLEYSDDKEVLIEILSEKTEIMKNKFNNFTEYLIKK